MLKQDIDTGSNYNDAAASSSEYMAPATKTGSHRRPTDQSESSSDKSADARLVDGLKRGVESAYRRFVDQYHGRMYSVAYRFLSNREDARDCVQDACIAIVENIGQFEHRSQLSTWVHRIVVNNALGRLRRRSRRKETDMESHLPKFDPEGYLIWPTSQVVEPVDRLLESELVARQVREAIHGLPGDYRDVLLLRDLQGYSTEEAANILGISPGAAKARLHRARSALKHILKPVLFRSEDQ